MRKGMQLGDRGVGAGKGNGTSLVLIAEDEPASRSLLHRYLSMEGYAVISAADGAEALEEFRRSPKQVALCLIDLHLPGLDGVSLIREIRKISRSVPIFLMSGLSEEEDSLEDVRDEILKRFVKPFDWQTLLHQIRRLLND